MRFTLAKPGMLKHFEGQWTVTAVEGEMHTALPECISAASFCPGSSRSFLRRRTAKAYSSASMCSSLESHACLMMRR